MEKAGHLKAEVALRADQTDAHRDHRTEKAGLLKTEVTHRAVRKVAHRVNQADR